MPSRLIASHRVATPTWRPRFTSLHPATSAHPTSPSPLTPPRHLRSPHPAISTTPPRHRSPPHITSPSQLTSPRPTWPSPLTSPRRAQEDEVFGTLLRVRTPPPPLRHRAPGGKLSSGPRKINLYDCASLWNGVYSSGSGDVLRAACRRARSPGRACGPDAARASRERKRSQDGWSRAAETTTAATPAHQARLRRCRRRIRWPTRPGSSGLTHASASWLRRLRESAAWANYYTSFA
jgi:hypothetical protein